MNVLLTSASRKVSLVQAFQHALGATGVVIAADITHRAAAMQLADKSVTVPRSDDPGFIDTVLALCEQHDVSLVVPTRDEELTVFARALPKFEAKGIRVHVSSVDAIETCQDKHRFHQFLVDAGFPVADRIETPTEADLPFFVRPRHGKASVGAARIETPAELAEISNDLSGLIANTLVDAPEYTIDVFIGADGTHQSAVARIRTQVVAGESYIGTTVDDPELSTRSIELCKALGLVGHNTVQAFRTEHGYSFIEINPRFGGAAALGFAAGAPSPTWLVQEVRGMPLDPAPASPTTGLTMFRYTQDVFVDEANIDS